MSEVLASSFSALPYRHGAIPETHPARIAAIARMLGCAAVAPDHCRVLELGCAGGMNLLPLAERFPDSEFLGVDFSAKHIEIAETAQRAAGIRNAQFLCADLRNFLPQQDRYDYIIAHGVYSWVAADVRDRLLHLCARSLKPAGIAYVSYNVYPAWGLIGGLRAMLRAALDRTPDPVTHAARLLPALERAFAWQQGPYATLVREQLADMLQRPPELLFHDELESVNEPVSFLDFIAHTERHGLHYLAEAHFASMPYEHLAEPARTALAELNPDFDSQQQFLDLLGNRRFRNSLLIRGAPPAARDLDPDVISQCAIGLHLRPAGGAIDLSPGVPLRLEGRHGFQLSVTAPAHKAFFAALCEVAPARVHFKNALEHAANSLRVRGVSETPEAGPLAAGLARLFSIDQCDLLLAGSGEWLDLPPNPAPSPLMRHQARAGLHVTNRWHEVVDLTEEDRRWVAGEGPSEREALLIRTGLAG
jgi:SAM-dependent methyltransferase